MEQQYLCIIHIGGTKFRLPVICARIPSKKLLSALVVSKRRRMALGYS